MTDPYETRHGPEYWQAQQEAALDALGFDWTWYGKSEVKMRRRRVVPSSQLEEALEEIARLKARIIEMRLDMAKIGLTGGEGMC
uniref:Uncharacterized protein n=1 Tax=viral metagenome TaxID=1070528 RepID=A0A6M3JK42_9ZZZZ